jgi:pimeloyl-ACP methyl ester carboxylesterase
MGLWSRFSPEKLEETGNRLIEYSGAKFSKSKVEVSQGNYMYCLTCGNPSNPPMILLHGYCGSGLIFYKIIKGLSEKYYIYLVDHLGMGRSSRPSFKAFSTFEAESFFVEALEMFRQEVGLESFILAGHSFGGYISGCYSLRYPTRVTKLLLLSPAGVAERPSEIIEDVLSWKFRWVNKFLLFFWIKNISLIEIMRKFGPFSGIVIRSYMKGKYNVEPNELEDVWNFLEQVNLLPGSGENGISYILDFNLWPYSPLCKRLPELSIPIAFFYGDRDWVVSDGGYKTKEISQSQVLIYTISNSDHHMYWDNPKELLEKMLDALNLMTENNVKL